MEVKQLKVLTKYISLVKVSMWVGEVRASSVFRREEEKVEKVQQ